MIVLESHFVSEEKLPSRLVDFVLLQFKNLVSRSAVKKAIKREEILLDGEKEGEGIWLKAGQKVEYIDLENKTPSVFELPLEVVFEDEYLALVNKPAGISVSGNKFKTIQNALTFNLKLSTEDDALKIPRPVHRLDYSTSGLLLIAKTARAIMHLGQQFENKQISKRYRAIVAGKTPQEGIVESAIKGQDSISRYKLVKHGRSLHTDWMSLIDLFPETGRTHQLRIHMSEAGFPMLGDDKYGDISVRLKGKSLFLSAVEMSSLHPKTGEVFTAKIQHPQKFNSFFEREQRRWTKYHPNEGI